MRKVLDPEDPERALKTHAISLLNDGKKYIIISVEPRRNLATPPGGCEGQVQPGEEVQRTQDSNTCTTINPKTDLLTRGNWIGVVPNGHSEPGDILYTRVLRVTPKGVAIDPDQGRPAIGLKYVQHPKAPNIGTHGVTNILFTNAPDFNAAASFRFSPAEIHGEQSIFCTKSFAELKETKCIKEPNICACEQNPGGCSDMRIVWRTERESSREGGQVHSKSSCEAPI